MYNSKMIKYVNKPTNVFDRDHDPLVFFGSNVDFPRSYAVSGWCKVDKD